MGKLDRQNVEEVLSLTPLQEGMLFHYLKDRGGDVYFEQLCLHISGRLDRSIFERAWKTVIEHNESLRTIFRWQGVKEPVQIILKESDFKPRHCDLSGQPGAVETLKARDRQERFDLSGVPFRVTLGRIADDRHLMLVSSHHILYDGWSNWLILKEFFEAYENGGHRPEPSRPPVKTGFREFVRWLQERDIEKEAAFWQAYLEDIDSTTGLLLSGRGRPDIGETGTHKVVFSRQEKEQLTHFVKEHKITPASFMYCAWGIILQKYNYRRDVVFGTVVSGRSAQIKGIEEMVGLFINTLPLRVQTNGPEKIVDFLERINREVQIREEYEGTPLVNIKEYSHRERQAELFDTIVGIENYPLDLAKLRKNSRLSLDAYSMQETTHYPLALNVSMLFDEMEAGLTFDPGRFEQSAIERLARHFRNAVRRIIDGPHKKTSELEILWAEERGQIIGDFNDTDADYPADRTIHQLVEEQVERTPRRIAVVGDDSHFSYDASNRRANRLAHQLRLRGVKAGMVVGILLESPGQRVTAMLAILKAGAAYLPLDPGQPLKRIAAMLTECQAPLLLTDSAAAGKRSFTLLQDLFQPGVTPYLTGVRAQVTRLDELPIPDRSLVNYDAYMPHTGQAWVKHSLAILASRGCPYKCAYCHKIWPGRHVVRSAENIFAEVKLFYDMGVRRFVIVDDIFNLDAQNSRRFFQLLVDNQLAVRLFFPNGLRGDLLTSDYIDLMAAAGTVSVALALETASPRLQKLIRKNLNIEKFRDNLEYLCKTYPQIISELFTMIGFPGETEEEALMTLDFIKSIDNIHFPYINILRIYANTDMYRMAIESGISPRAIFDSENLYFHELPDTLPFDKNFALKLQTDFLNGYFLSKERLLRVLPRQMKILSEEEIVQKYNSYLQARIGSLPELLHMADIGETELPVTHCLDERQVAVPGLAAKIEAHFPRRKPAQGALKILLLDLCQFFSRDTDRLDVVFDPPLGLMLVMTYLNRRFGDRVDGRIAKSRLDFDSFRELKALVEAFRPDIIGLRSLTYYRDLFHQAAALIRQWGIEAPIVAGGPYATGSYDTILQDRNIDLVVLGEGEITFAEFIEEMLKNGNRMPTERVLEKIPGLAFVPAKARARQILMLDEMEERLAEARDENPAPAGTPRQPAYVMFTSGSTGQPKGVMIEHRSVVNTVNWFGKTFGVDGSTHLLQLSDYTFDPSVEDIFGSLVHGAVLHLIDKQRLLDPQGVRRFIRQRQIHIIDQVPPLLDELLADGERLESLQVVISGGMPLDERLKGRLIARGYRLYNNYGPTEITVDALCGQCTDGPVTLGKPIANAHCYILDKDRQLAPIGAAGELCIAGTGLARGYLNNPELTADKFINLAAKGREGTRSPKNQPLNHKSQPLYCTGDLCRFLPDGSVEFLGRIDRQVKIRGVRIELSEIENRLLTYPGLREAAVTVRGEEENDRHLCAYIVPQTSRTNETSPLKLRQYLSRTLPAYMIPAHFVLLDEMPRTAAGKIDRRALPAPAGQRPADGSSGTVTATGVEGRLAGIWARVLKIDRERIGRDQSFFDLGGHSLRATRLMSEIYKEFNVKMDIDQIFQTPSLQGLSEIIEKSKAEIYESIPPVEEREYYPLSSAQKRMYLLNHLKESDISDNSPGAVMLEGRVSRAHLQSVFEQLIQRHEILRTSFILRGSEPVQVVHPQVPFGLDYADSRDDQIDREIERFVRPFDLAAAPLLRVRLLKLAGQRYLLIYDMHHIIVDDTSALLFLKEFIALYNGRELPRPRLQYRDFALWQNEQQDSRQLREQEHYWLNVFAVPPPPFELPLDFPRPLQQSFEGRFIRGHFPPDLTAAVNRLAREYGATLYMVLLALTSILLGRSCGAEDVVVGTPIAGRLHPDLYDIMGFFVNTLAMRSFPEGHKTFGRFLLEVKAAVLAAFENQDYPFDRLAGQVAAVQEVGRQRLFDTMLVVQNVDIPLQELLSRIEGATFTPYEFQKQATQFDILLHAFESETEIGFRLDYATRLFKEETAAQLLEHLANIAREVTANPRLKISAIQIFSDQEQRALKVPSSWERLSQAAEEVDFDF
jgi:amino acid adenylation domain-containing protein